MRRKRTVVQTSGESRRPPLRRLLVTLVSLLAALTMGQTCDLGPIRRAVPANGYTVIDTILDPVKIEGQGLHGAGWISAFKQSGDWQLIHLAPGSFVFEDYLPFDSWHCAPDAAKRGCVAKLRVGDETGILPTGKADGAIYVCTADYQQSGGRRHCGRRMFQGATESLILNREKTDSIGHLASSDPIMEWHGDPLSRLVTGSASIPYAGHHDPPAETGEIFSSWGEYAYDPDYRMFVYPDSSMSINYDLGACSVFIPWEWQDRIPDAIYTAQLGANSGNRGLAEVFLDNILDTAEPMYRTEVNAMLWIDATVGIRPAATSPEFHFWVSPDDGTPRICLKQYSHVSSDISAAPDSWYRFDQALGAFFINLFPFIGQCGEKSTSIFYCGTPTMTNEPLSQEEIAIELENNAMTGAPLTDPNGPRGTFIIDEELTFVSHQGYPWGKVLCNNQFVPKYRDGVYDSFTADGEGSKLLDRGIRALVNQLSSVVSLDVRRLEITPTGMYLITAEDTSDPQYGLGHCYADLDRSGLLPPVAQPQLIKEYGIRGITRPYPPQ